jgi:hypothetical protein
MDRKTWATFLLLGAIIVAIIGGIWWSPENDRVAKANAQSALTRAVGNEFVSRGGYQPADVSPNHGPQIVLFVVAGAAGLFGMLLIAGAPSATGGPRAPEATAAPTTDDSWS